MEAFINFILILYTLRVTQLLAAALINGRDPRPNLVDKIVLASNSILLTIEAFM